MAQKYPRPTETAMTFGEDRAIRMSQKTLLFILGITAAAVGGWFNLKMEARDNTRAISELVNLRATDIAQQKADRELLLRAVAGVESLQRRADWQDRRDGRSSSSTTGSSPSR